MIKITIEQRGATPELAKRRWNTIKRVAFFNAGIFWHSRLLPKHFTWAGSREYNYRHRTTKEEGFTPPRTGSFSRMLFRGNPPLVFTGESRERALTLRNVKATRNGVRIAINAPRLNLSNLFTRNPTMREEVTTVSAGDFQQLSDVFAESVERQLAAITDVKRKRI